MVWELFCWLSPSQHYWYWGVVATSSCSRSHQERTFERCQDGVAISRMTDWMLRRHIPGCRIIYIFQNTYDNMDHYQRKGEMCLRNVSDHASLTGVCQSIGVTCQRQYQHLLSQQLGRLWEWVHASKRLVTQERDLEGKLNDCIWCSLRS